MQSVGQFRVVEVPSGVGLSRRGNLTGTERRLKDSVADFHNCVVRWTKHNVDGAGVLRSISNLVIGRGSARESEGPEFEKYAAELKGYVAELRIVVGKLEGLVEKMKTVTSHGEALAELSRCRSLGSSAMQEGNIFFHSWPVENFASAFKSLADAYESELAFKRRVVSGVAHCGSRRELMLYVSVWLYDASIPPDVRNLVDAMLYETGHLAV